MPGILSIISIKMNGSHNEPWNMAPLISQCSQKVHFLLKENRFGRFLLNAAFFPPQVFVKWKINTENKMAEIMKWIMES
uniref:Uncharacterized protein n=1 Tax=Anguilla anguilla TaxID=7936 RepID=A0A0E9QQK5_ANGAN